MSDSGKGFGGVNPIIHKFISAKGGRRKVSKGFGSLSPERRKEIAARGGKAKYENRSKEQRPKTDGPSIADYDFRD